jgi:hypothetical protein
MNVNKRKKDNKPDDDDNDEKEKGKAKRSKIVVSDHGDDDVENADADVDVVGDGNGADLTDSDVYRAEAPEKEKEKPSSVSSSSASSSATAVASLPSAPPVALEFKFRLDSDGFRAGKQSRCRCPHKDCGYMSINEKLHGLHWQICHGSEKCLKPESVHSYRCRVDPCQDGSKIFTRPKDRSRHEQVVHGVNTKTKRTPQFYFLTGHNIHGNKFCCRFCFKDDFEHLQSRNKHELGGCDALFKSVKCYHRGCPKRFRSIEERDLHSRECKPASQPVKLARGLDMGIPDESTGEMYFPCNYDTRCKQLFRYSLHPTDQEVTKQRRSNAMNSRDRHNTRHRDETIKQKKEDVSADKKTATDKSTASSAVDSGTRPIYVLRPKTVASSSSSAAAWSPSDIYALPLSGQPIEKMMNSSSIPVPITTRTTTTTTQTTTTTTMSLGYPSASSSSSSSTGEKPKKSLSSGLLVKSFSMGGGGGGGNGDVSQFGDLEMLALAATPLMVKDFDGNEVSVTYPFVPESQNPVVTASQAKQIIDFTSADADDYSGLLLDDEFAAAANPLEKQSSFPFS